LVENGKGKIMEAGIITDASKILRNWYIKDDPAKLDSLRKDHINAEIAAQIYRLRANARLSQKQLAELIGTTQSVISRLEDADYSGHSLDTINRIAAAFSCNVCVRIVPEKRSAVLPFELHIPNKLTARTMAKVDAGRDLHEVSDVDELFRELDR
jgi:transcriptional regulator with XRE-family HTH domain